MAEIMELLKIYKDFGIATFFIALELGTVFFFYKHLNKSKDDAVTTTEKVITALDKASNALLESSRASGEIKDGMDHMRTQNNEYIAFLKGRDEHRRPGR